MSRFLFLTDFDDELYRLCRDAENYLYKDNTACLYKARLADEYIVNSFVGSKQLFSGIERIEEENLAGKDIVDFLDVIRRKGNNAVHYNKATDEDAKISIDALVYVTFWYVLGKQGYRCKLDFFSVDDFSYVKSYYGEEDFNEFLKLYNKQTNVKNIETKNIQFKSGEDLKRELLVEVEEQKKVLSSNLDFEGKKSQVVLNSLNRIISEEANQDITTDKVKFVTNIISEEINRVNSSTDRMFVRIIKLMSVFSIVCLCYVFMSYKTNSEDIERLNKKIENMNLLSSQTTANYKNNSRVSRYPLNSNSLELADAGDMKEQLKVGLAYCDGNGLPKDTLKGMNYLKKSAEQGYREGEFFYGIYLLMGNKSEQEEGFKWVLSAADRGNVNAQYAVARAYEDGIGVEKDEKKYIKYLKMAADNNYREAALILGNCYAEGIGVLKNVDLGILYLKSAIDREDGDIPKRLFIFGNYKLGCLYINERKYIHEGIKYLSYAANSGYGPAQYALATCYEKGIGVIQDKEKAKDLYIKAKSNGVKGE
jgi:TPR repeat protein